MANFSVIAKNNKLEQINNIDDLQYAFEMYKYLAFEMDFPDVKLIDNETAEVLLYIKRETTSYEYISPLLMRAFQKGEENADAPIEPNGVSEETADHNCVEEELADECRNIIATFLKAHPHAPNELKLNLLDIYNRINANQYDYSTLKYLKKVLEEISKNY
jgi:hypothetical protein